MVDRHLQAGVGGPVHLLDAVLQHSQDVVGENSDGKAEQRRTRVAKAADLALQRRLKALEHPLNGLIANDKFCWARTLQLRLSWSRARKKLKEPTPRHL